MEGVVAVFNAVVGKGTGVVIIEGSDCGAEGVGHRQLGRSAHLHVEGECGQTPLWVVAVIPSFVEISVVNRWLSY